MNINKAGWLVGLLAILGLNFAIANDTEGSKAPDEQSVNGTADHEFDPPPPPPGHEG